MGIFLGLATLRAPYGLVALHAVQWWPAPGTRPWEGRGRTGPRPALLAVPETSRPRNSCLAAGAGQRENWKIRTQEYEKARTLPRPGRFRSKGGLKNFNDKSGQWGQGAPYVSSVMSDYSGQSDVTFSAKWEKSWTVARPLGTPGCPGQLSGAARQPLHTLLQFRVRNVAFESLIEGRAANT